MKAQLYHFAYRLHSAIMGKLALNILILFIIQYFLTGNVNADSSELSMPPEVTTKDVIIGVAIWAVLGFIFILCRAYTITTK